MTDHDCLKTFVTSRDESAFATMVQRHQAMVYRICLRRLGDHDEARDAMQDVFVKLYVGAETIQFDLTAWLRRCASNTAISQLRSKISRRKYESRWEQEAEARHDEMEFEESRRIVRECLTSLAERDRELVERHLLGGQPQSTIATDWGVSQQAVAKRLNRVKQMLRLELVKRGIAALGAGLAATLPGRAAVAGIAKLAASFGTAKTVKSVAVATAVLVVATPLPTDEPRAEPTRTRPSPVSIGASPAVVLPHRTPGFEAATAFAAVPTHWSRTAFHPPTSLSVNVTPAFDPVPGYRGIGSPRKPISPRPAPVAGPRPQPPRSAQSTATLYDRPMATSFSFRSSGSAGGGSDEPLAVDTPHSVKVTPVATKFGFSPDAIARVGEARLIVFEQLDAAFASHALAHPSRFWLSWTFGGSTPPVGPGSEEATSVTVSGLPWRNLGRVLPSDDALPTLSGPPPALRWLSRASMTGPAFVVFDRTSESGQEVEPWLVVGETSAATVSTSRVSVIRAGGLVPSPITAEETVMPLVAATRPRQFLAGGAVTLLTAGSAGAGTIITGSDPAAYQSLAQQSQYDSVGLMTWDGGLASGVYLGDGWVLTAAHVAEASDDLDFTLGGDTYQSQDIYVHEQWAGDPSTGNDIALVKLTSDVIDVEAAQLYTVAPASNEAVIPDTGTPSSGSDGGLNLDAWGQRVTRQPGRFGPRGFSFAGPRSGAFMPALFGLSDALTDPAVDAPDEADGLLGATATFVGFGQTGNGSEGVTDAAGTKLAGQNVIEAFGGDTFELRDFDDSTFFVDFDDPNALSDAYRWSADQALALEYLIAPGDSGGGVFVEDGGDTYLVGINSFLLAFDGNPDADYGDLAGITYVPDYTDWIYQTTGWSLTGATVVPEVSTFAIINGLSLFTISMVRRRPKASA